MTGQGRALSLVSLLAVLVGARPCEAFVTPRASGCAFPSFVTASFACRTETTGWNDNFLLREFRIASGEVIQPYDVLKVPRKATRVQVRAAYIKLCRLYHPDASRHRVILPGRCNNLDEVRNHWERIKLAYEILSNSKTRKRYDRHEALADPGAAVQRAAVNAAFSGISGMGNGLLGVGSFALQSIKKNGAGVSDCGVQK